MSAKPATKVSPKVAGAAAVRAKATAAALRPSALAEGSVLQSLYGTLGSLIMVAALLAFVYGNERADIMFAVNHEGQLTPLQAMNHPNTSSEAVLNWSKMAVGEIFTYNFNDIVPRLNASRRFFTTQGWNSFRSAFQEQSILLRTQSQRQFVTTLPSGAATIVEEGDQKGRYYWTLQLETITSVYAGTSNINSNTMTLRIQRIPTGDSVAGYPFGIIQIQ